MIIVSRRGGRRGQFLGANIRDRFRTVLAVQTTGSRLGRFVVYGGLSRTVAARIRACVVVNYSIGFWYFERFIFVC